MNGAAGSSLASPRRSRTLDAGGAHTLLERPLQIRDGPVADRRDDLRSLEQPRALLRCRAVADVRVRQHLFEGAAAAGLAHDVVREILLASRRHEQERERIPELHAATVSVATPNRHGAVAPSTAMRDGCPSGPGTTRPARGAGVPRPSGTRSARTSSAR